MGKSPDLELHLQIILRTSVIRTMILRLPRLVSQAWWERSYVNFGLCKEALLRG